MTTSTTTLLKSVGLKPAIVALALVTGACADMPVAEIGAMSDSRISVVTLDGVAGPGTAAGIARAHCDILGVRLLDTSSRAGGMPDRTVRTYRCGEDLQIGQAVFD